MRRALFAREFRSALVPNLITVVAILATLAVIEWIFGRSSKGEDLRDAIDVVLLAGLVVSGFISGERCFPSEVKESRMLFFASLPIPRSSAWLMIVSARLLAALVSLVVVLTVRRPLLLLLYSGRMHRPDFVFLGGLLFFAYSLLFSAGALFALLFRRALFSYVAGVLVLGGLSFETALAASYSRVFPQIPELSKSPLAIVDAPPPARLVALLSLLLIMALLLCRRFFVLGEINSLKRRGRNQILSAIGAVIFLGVVFCVESSTTPASVGSTWTINNFPTSQVGEPPFYGVSPDGRYLSVIEASEDRPFIRRVTIIETTFGHAVGQQIFAGAGWFFWASHGDVLNLLALNNSPLDRWGYLVPGTADWIRLSPETRELSRIRLEGIEEIQPLGEGRALAVLRQEGQGRVLLLNGASGRFSELLRAPLDGSAAIVGRSPSALVYFNNILFSPRAWLVDSLVHEVHISSPVLELAYVLFGEISGSQLEARVELSRKFGSPSAAEGKPIRGELVLPPPHQLLDLTSRPDTPGLFFLEGNREGPLGLWARPTTLAGRWERLPSLASNRVLRFASDFIDFPSGIATFLSTEGRGSFFVYDPRVGVVRETGNCDQGDKAFLNASQVPGLNGFLIGLSCTDNLASSHGQAHYFQYIPGSGKVRVITESAVRPALSHLYFDEKGTDVWMAFEDRTIWISIPGRKDLRLWPLQTL